MTDKSKSDNKCSGLSALERERRCRELFFRQHEGEYFNIERLCRYGNKLSQIHPRKVCIDVTGKWEPRNTVQLDDEQEIAIGTSLREFVNTLVLDGLLPAIHGVEDVNAFFAERAVLSGWLHIGDLSIGKDLARIESVPMLAYQWARKYVAYPNPENIPEMCGYLITSRWLPENFTEQDFLSVAVELAKLIHDLDLDYSDYFSWILSPKGIDTAVKAGLIGFDIYRGVFLARFACFKMYGEPTPPSIDVAEQMGLLNSELDATEKPEIASTRTDIQVEPTSTSTPNIKTTSPEDVEINTGIASDMNVRSWKSITLIVDTDLVTVKSGDKKQDCTFKELGFGRGKTLKEASVLLRLFALIAKQSGEYTPFEDESYSGKGGIKKFQVHLTRLNKLLISTFGINDNPVILNDKDIVETKFTIYTSDIEYEDENGHPRIKDENHSKTILASETNRIVSTEKDTEREKLKDKSRL